MSVKLERLGNAFVEEISKIINREIDDDNLKFISITYCKITSDLSYAKVYFSTLNKDKIEFKNVHFKYDKDEVLKALNRHNKFIRGRLSNCVDIRKMPELIFVYDESIDYGKKIEDIIERIHENE